MLVHEAMFKIECLLPYVREIFEAVAHGIVVLFPSDTLQDGIGVRKRDELKFRRRRKVILCENLFGLLLLVRIFLHVSEMVDS